MTELHNIMTKLNSATCDYFSEVSVTSLTSSNVLFISKNLYMFVMSITLGIICQTIVVFGVITNILNIIIFVKQGFLETINISLLALTLSDLLSLLAMMWSGICYSSNFETFAVHFDPDDVQLLTGGWPHVIFTRTTGLITTFISFERCVCVICPLKVKTILTRKRNITIMILIFVITIACASLAYVVAGLGWRYFPERNTTLVGLVYHLDDYGQIITNSLTYAVNGVLLPMSSFLAVVICTVVLIVKLNQNAVWRQSNLSSASNEVNTLGKGKIPKSKNLRVAKMVVLLSIIFIASFIPAAVTFIAGCIEPQLSYFGIYKHIFMITLSVSFTAEVFNSSTNIFVYFTMSTKYKETFLSLFKFKRSHTHL